MLLDREVILMEFVGTHTWTSIDEKYFSQGGNSFLHKVKGLSEGVFALKLYKFDHISGERYKRFLDEISVVKELSEIEGCVSCLDHGFHQEKPFYVMPYFSNGNFREKYFNGASRSEEKKLEDFLKVLQIVKSIHSTGLAIRDIKPQNILIDNDNNPVIADFGLSLWVDICDEDRETLPTGMVGSQGYRPPEWHTKYPEPNHRPGDIWSLGRTLWAMMAGINPPNNYETLGGNGTHLNQYVDKRHANIVQSLITSCTSQDPAQRPAIDELINQVTNIRRLIGNNSQEDEKIRESISQTLSKFHLQLSNSEAYIDSQRLESEINIKISEIQNCSNLLAGRLNGYVDEISKGIPNDLGEFRVFQSLTAGAFLDQEELTISISENRGWGTRTSLKFTPSERIRLHKSINYIELSFHMGLTETKSFYWIVGTLDTGILEQIEARSLEGMVCQKMDQLDEFVGQHFLARVEKHFK